MVHLLCAERGVTPNRPTDDGDAVLDVRARPAILNEFTSVLRTLGFVSAGESMEGHQHRWLNDEAKIDVLIPRHVGERAARRRGASGGTTLETPGAQQALDRAELIEVSVQGHGGRIPRPNMAGALVIKAAAYANTRDSYRERHLTDFRDTHDTDHPIRSSGSRRSPGGTRLTCGRCSRNAPTGRNFSRRSRASTEDSMCWPGLWPKVRTEKSGPSRRLTFRFATPASRRTRDVVRADLLTAGSGTRSICEGLCQVPEDM